MSEELVLSDSDWWGTQKKRKAKSDNLHRAKRAKDDEWRTRREDIEKEMSLHGRMAFNNKVIYCNCDDPESEFFRYFNERAGYLGIKSLLRHSIDEGGFGSRESIELLKRADIVITNPPFSLFVPFLQQLIEHAKDFLIIGSVMAAAGLKEMFQLIQQGKARIGYSPRADKFLRPDGSIKRAACYWFTTLPVERKPIDLTENYRCGLYPRYDGEQIIEVKRTSLIPKDWEGLMGVPVSFLEKHDPRQFEIIGKKTNFAMKGKTMPARVIIRRQP